MRSVSESNSQWQALPSKLWQISVPTCHRLHLSFERCSDDQNFAVPSSAQPPQQSEQHKCKPRPALQRKSHEEPLPVWQRVRDILDQMNLNPPGTTPCGIAAGAGVPAAAVAAAPAPAPAPAPAAAGGGAAAHPEPHEEEDFATQVRYARTGLDRMFIGENFAEPLGERGARRAPSASAGP